MKYNTLGNTGLTVSELCFGVLPMGPLQAGLPAEDGGKVLLAALEQGVTFFDTAQMYGTYAHLRWALQRWPGPQPVIASKSVAKDYAGMEAAIQEALSGLGRDYLDIFLLHAARDTENSLAIRADAWQCLLDYKQKGYIRAVGVSSHSVANMRALAIEPGVDVLFPLLNKAGLGVMAGSRDEMIAAARQAAATGKGLYSMKALGGGVLLSQIQEALGFNRGLGLFAAHAVGMVKEAELALNLRLFNDEVIPTAELAQVKNVKRWTLMEICCKGCGHCVEGCHSNALAKPGRYPVVDESKCLLCGYCAADCPEFAIRVV